MKKITSLILIFVFCLTLYACESKNTDDTTQNNNINKPTGVNDNVNTGNKKISLKASDLSIDDFVWETNLTKSYGKDCYSFSLINNSEYDIIAVEFTYQVKDTATDDDLKLYDEFMNDHDGYIEADDSPRDVILRGSVDRLVAKGDELTDMKFTVGFKNWAWYDYPTKEQFNLMEPKEMELGIIGNDNILYIAYYDFKEDLWVLDENSKPVDTWSDKEIAQKISRPNEGHHIVVKDEEDKFKVYSYGVNIDNYNQYVQTLKNSGFKEEKNTSTHFEGKNTNGYIVELWYTADDEKLSISIEIDS